MSKKLGVFILIVGALLTLLSYTYSVHGINYRCTFSPSNPGPLDDLALSRGQLKDHGLPLQFYTNGSPDNCILSDDDPGADGPTQIKSQLNAKNLLIDYAAWTFIAGGITVAVQKGSKK
jgi:hypothetical protein